MTFWAGQRSGAKQILRPRSIPSPLKRVYEALLAKDPIRVAEAYALDARMATQYDDRIATSFGFQSNAPIVASSAVGILRLPAYELSMIQVTDTDTDIVSASEDNGGLDVVSRWSIKLQSNGSNHEGYCRQRWVLDRGGRRLPPGATLVASSRASDSKLSAGQI